MSTTSGAGVGVGVTDWAGSAAGGGLLVTDCLDAGAGVGATGPGVAMATGPGLGAEDSGAFLPRLSPALMPCLTLLLFEPLSDLCMKNNDTLNKSRMITAMVI